MLPVYMTIAVAIGFFCAGALWGCRMQLHWKIIGINLEHDLARLQNRKPRDINDIKIDKKGLIVNSTK